MFTATLFLAFALGQPQEETIDVCIESSTLPFTAASQLKSNKVTVEVKDEAPKKVNLIEVLSGKNEMPKKGQYFAQKILVTKDGKYNTYEVFVSKPLKPGTKLHEFAHRGSFTGMFGDVKRKCTYFEATVVRK